MALALVATALVALIALRLVVEACDAILLAAVCWLLHSCLVALANKCLGLLARTVEGDNLSHAADGKRGEVSHSALARREGHSACQGVNLNQEPLAIEGLQGLAQAGDGAACIGIYIILVHQAALQLRALTRQLLGVERNLLHARSICRHAREARNPRCTTQLAATGTDTSDAARLLACANLLHLDADVEALGKDLDKLAEVDTLVGDVVEYSLELVALVLHIANLHV